jgi:hypothetical protein
VGGQAQWLLHHLAAERVFLLQLCLLVGVCATCLSLELVALLLQLLQAAVQSLYKSKHDKMSEL